jgi:hypothetical protein
MQQKLTGKEATFGSFERRFYAISDRNSNTGESYPGS